MNDRIESAPDETVLFEADVPAHYACHWGDSLPVRVVVRRVRGASSGGIVVHGKNGFLGGSDPKTGETYRGRPFGPMDRVDENGEYANLGERAAVRLLVERVAELEKTLAGYRSMDDEEAVNAALAHGMKAATASIKPVDYEADGGEEIT